MSTPISQFTYDLPKELIAQHSVEPRDSSRLMLLDRETGEIQHKHFYDILDELDSGDVLVFNDTKVFRARLEGKKEGVIDVEVFLLRCVKEEKMLRSFWKALLRPGKKILIGDVIVIDGLEVVVREKQEDGIALLEVPVDESAVLLFTDMHGEIPTPPYVDEKPASIEQYQTVYAREVGSVAAPTAGFHFTNKLLENIKAKGVELAFVTLHVGIGTFRPVQTETIEEHQMHAEFVTITKETATQINRAKKEGRRVVAVGTTTVRSLEGAAMLSGGKLPEEFSGDVNMFIKPGFEFRVIDALITNFHLPKSTLLVLVSALAGREHILHAYEEAVREKYRFFSFGDAMFIRKGGKGGGGEEGEKGE
jgi:S-adenosylmethionine:tRNA ribosyltransferase-isomerase